MSPPPPPPPLRVAFFGTPSFAVPSLEALIGAAHVDVVGVVTQPDKPRGRGHRVTVGPVKAVALEHGLRVLQPARLRRETFEAEFAALHVDLGVVAAYGKILPRWLLDAPRLGLVNVHASLLPRYRGAAPVHRAVMAGERETGVTIMRVVEALDAGPMLAAAARAIGPDERSDEVEAGLATLGAGLLIDTLPRLVAGDVVGTGQDEAAATYASRLTREDGRLDWSVPARAVHDRVRGLHPWPHAFTYLDGVRFIVLRTSLSDVKVAARPGTIVKASEGRLAVACGDGGVVDLLEIQMEGRRRMTARELLSGRAIDEGRQFAADEA